MVAPLILLDWSLTLWTVLGVGNHPGDVLTFTFVLGVPFQGSLATARSVAVLISFKSEKVPTFTLHFLGCI